jgi:hypothetical protein
MKEICIWTPIYGNIERLHHQWETMMSNHTRKSPSICGQIYFPSQMAVGYVLFAFFLKKKLLCIDAVPRCAVTNLLLDTCQQQISL